MGTVNRGKRWLSGSFRGILFIGGDKNPKLNGGHQWLCCSLCWQDPQLGRSNAEEEGHVCLCSSPAWAELLLREATLEFLKTCQCGICASENGFPLCAQWTFASKEAYATVGEGGQPRLLMPLLNQSAVTNSLQREEVTDAVKKNFLGRQERGFWEPVKLPVFSANRVCVLRLNAANMSRGFL